MISLYDNKILKIEKVTTVSTGKLFIGNVG